MSYDGDFTFDMRPQAGILNVFSRLSYKPQYAIGEFVDNSTQSYLLHKAELIDSEDYYRLRIDIEYDPGAMTLTVTDNAFGMERDRFLDAIKLDAKNSDQMNSRNEFGMGLKTAASWFGSVWSVTSTQLGSRRRFKATVDIPCLHESGESDINIRVTDEPPYTHGTVVRIEKLTKKLAGRSIGKIKDMLGSMYRRDLANGDVEIMFNGQPITFEQFPILRFRDQQWKKPLDFEFDFGPEKHHVTGFVAIMDPGSFIKAGFALFRRGRVVIGGADANYKPREIFGNANSEISLKLFGELDLDDFPINQAKDGFVWEDGLEDAFIDALKMQIADFRKIADMTKKARMQESQLATPASNRVEAQVTDTITRLNNGLSKARDDAEEAQPEKADTSDAGESAESRYVQDYREMQREESKVPDELLSDVRTYPIKVSSTQTKTIEVRWSIESGEKWIGVTYPTDDSVAVTINLNHPFFKPYSREEDFQVVLEKLVIAFVASEEQAKLNSTQAGMIISSAIRSNMNRILYAMAVNGNG